MRLLKHKKQFLLIIALCLVVAGGGLIWAKTRPEQAHTCPTLLPPVETGRVVSILYPGQLRGGDYKAHGGFRVDGDQNDGVTVRAPLDAKLVAAGRYIEQSEVQNIMDFESACGLNYRFDHLLTLAPKFQAIMDKQPKAVVSTSNTYVVKPSVQVTAGEVIATGVGFRKGEHGPNISFDFGVYDRGAKNKVSQDPQWAAVHTTNTGQTHHALCWLDLLPSNDREILKTLPGGDHQSGKTSDYCN